MQSKPTQARGPYIVTTWPECPGCADPSSAPHLAKPPLSRRAVATLEEAREAYDAASMAITDASGSYESTPAEMPESGGSVGPLPDGTVIEVEPTTYHALWHAVPWDSGLRGGAYMETDGDQNIAAFNAWQEGQHA